MLRKKAALDLELRMEQESGEQSPQYKEEFTVDPDEAAMFNECPPNLSQPLIQNMSPRLHLDFPRYAPPSADMIAMRRGSAPPLSIGGTAQGPVRSSYVSDASGGRRGPNEPSSAHPYMRRDISNGPGLYRSNSETTLADPLLGSVGPSLNAWPRIEGGRPQLSHRSSMPHFDQGQRQPWSFQRPAPLPLHRDLYNDQSRSNSSPIPGPLPSPTFTFGAAPDIPITPPEGKTTFGFVNRHDVDGEEDSASEAYDRYSRFGSLASDSSATSAYLSEKEGAGSDATYPPGFQRDMPRSSVLVFNFSPKKHYSYVHAQCSAFTVFEPHDWNGRGSFDSYFAGVSIVH